MIEILQKHLASYPKMQIRDAAKLLYQSEFGGGHMIANPDMSLKRIHEEFVSLDSHTLNSVNVLEPIGNDIYRIYLSSLSNGLTEETLNQMFVQSANHKKGTVVALEHKIEDVLNACREGTLQFSETSADEFFAEWKSQGYPAISHSEVYRNNYFPAYRVIEGNYARLYEIIQEIYLTLTNVGNLPLVIAVDGMSGSGKSTLGELLHKNFPESNLFHMDDFFLQPYQRTEERLLEVGGNIDYERFKKEILDCLGNKKGLNYRTYDCCTQELEEYVHIPWKPLVIIEGSYSQHPYFGNAYDIKIFCEVSAETQRERILKRNGEYMLQRFEKEWIPKENVYFEKFKIKNKADFYLPTKH